MTRLTRFCRAVGVGLAVATATLSMTQAADAAPKASSMTGNVRRQMMDPLERNGMAKFCLELSRQVGRREVVVLCALMCDLDRTQQ